MPKMCQQCGTENSDTAKFCKQCAVPLRGDSASRCPKGHIIAPARPSARSAKQKRISKRRWWKMIAAPFRRRPSFRQLFSLWGRCARTFILVRTF